MRHFFSEVYPQPLYNWNPFWGTILLEVSVGRDFGALKELRPLLRKLIGKKKPLDPGRKLP